jgi:8-oxo-dGTP pyrophosphatase MutT (NUDIX family)
MAKDILFDADSGLFGLRSAGVLIKDNRVLLQQAGNDPGYAIPGGHVSFGELGEEALIREFKEEIGIDIKVVRMLWIGEIFFPWADKDCHQICLYYLVEPCSDEDEPVIWDTVDKVESYEAHIKFSWVDIGDLDDISRSG